MTKTFLAIIIFSIACFSCFAQAPPPQPKPEPVPPNIEQVKEFSCHVEQVTLKSGKAAWRAKAIARYAPLAVSSDGVWAADRPPIKAWSAELRYRFTQKRATVDCEAWVSKVAGRGKQQ